MLGTGNWTRTWSPIPVLTGSDVHQLSDDNIAKQALCQWIPDGHRGRGRPENTWKRDLEKGMLTPGFRKIECWRQKNGMETGGLSPVLHWEQQGISQVWFISSLSISPHRNYHRSVERRFIVDNRLTYVNLVNARQHSFLCVCVLVTRCVQNVLFHDYCAPGPRLFSQLHAISEIRKSWQCRRGRLFVSRDCWGLSAEEQLARVARDTTGCEDLWWACCACWPVQVYVSENGG